MREIIEFKQTIMEISMKHETVVVTKNPILDFDVFVGSRDYLWVTGSNLFENFEWFVFLLKITLNGSVSCRGDNHVGKSEFLKKWNFTTVESW